MTVVVSGAGSGIGRAVATRLAAAGSPVLAVGRREEPLRQLVGDRCTDAIVLGQ